MADPSLQGVSIDAFQQVSHWPGTDRQLCVSLAFELSTASQTLDCSASNDLPDVEKCRIRIKDLEEVRAVKLRNGLKSMAINQETDAIKVKAATIVTESRGLDRIEKRLVCARAVDQCVCHGID